MAVVVQYCTAQKMKFSVTDFFSKCDQIRSFLRTWSHLLKKSVMENFIFCALLKILAEIFSFVKFKNLLSDEVKRLTG